MKNDDLKSLIENYSPFLSGLMRNHRDLFDKYCQAEKSDELLICEIDKILTEAGQLLSDLENHFIIKDRLEDKDYQPEIIMNKLRIMRNKTALLTALGDISGDLGFDEVVTALSDFAVFSVKIALIYAHNSLLLQKYGDDEGLKSYLKGQNPIGIIILAMGKLGTHTLNYSSDIDLICFYEPNHYPFIPRHDIGKIMVKITHLFSRVLEERTAKGYVFRLDFRLRPDPSSTPPSMPIDSARVYYETMGLNWERAALMKASMIAGNERLGTEFLNDLKPFIWRKNLDFSSIQEIKSIRKRMSKITSIEKNHLAGYNIKKDPGGIREIEFYAQVWQLIWGGRHHELRKKGTVSTLNSLVKDGRIDQKTADDLTNAYLFLRTLEHRLQMIDDRQTQTLPSDEGEIEKLAKFLLFENSDDFKDRLIHHLNIVNGYYNAFFIDNHDELLQKQEVVRSPMNSPTSLKQLGFENIDPILKAIERWNRGQIRATRTPRAQEILKILLPHFLQSLANTQNPDQAFFYFDQFLSNLPEGVQILSLFESNPNLFELVSFIMGHVPRFADLLAKETHIWETMIEDGFFTEFGNKDDLINQLTDFIRAAPIDNYEQKLVSAREFVAEKQFQAGMQYLKTDFKASIIQKRLSDLADAVIATLMPLIWQEFAKLHGDCALDFAIIALGKQGSCELMPESDLDLICIYDLKEGATLESNGAKPLHHQLYAVRLAQRLISALTQQMKGGRLYEVDMRLRPGGESSNAAISFERFMTYYTLTDGQSTQNHAWSFEYMAMTRGRVVYANNDAFKMKLNQGMTQILSQNRDKLALQHDLLNMRHRLLRDKKPRSLFDIKRAHGGLVDIEFIIQYKQLLLGQDYQDFVKQSDAQILDQIDALHRMGQIKPSSADIISHAYRLYSAMQILFRLYRGNEGAVMDEHITDYLLDDLKNLCKANDLIAIKQKLQTYYDDIKICFANEIAPY